MRLPLLAATLTLALTLLPGGARAGDRAGDFDYYVAVLSWNATWCAIEGDERGADQCDPRHDIGFVLHGLWPQHEDGSWPEYCTTTEPDPSRRDTAAMADIMGSPGLAWHQWQKHGRCAGIGAGDYFALAREAWGRIARPDLLERVAEPLRVDPEVIEAAFLEANPWLRDPGISVSCRDGMVHEVRVCFSPALTPRACTGRVARDCTGAATFPPMR